jgi:hypothetical protein|tara:strand:- start:33178 stop:35037 length:1860 start_codon:yes stop_codon:yes gene_type:complete
VPAFAKAAFVDREAPQAEWRAIHRIADAAQPRVSSAIRKALAVSERATSWSRVREHLQLGNLEQAIEAVDVDAASDAILKEAWPSILKVFVRAGQVVGEQVTRRGGLRKQASPIAVAPSVFRETNPLAVEWAEQHAAVLVTNVAGETRLAVRGIVVESFQDQVTPLATAKRIRQVVGVNAQQAVALGRLRDELAAAGVSQAGIARRIGFEAAKARRARSVLIARTEIMMAANGGQLSAWQQARSAKLLDPEMVREWIVTPDDRLCPICGAMEGEQVALDETFSIGGPPAHPACRCTTGLALPRPEGKKAPSIGGADIGGPGQALAPGAINPAMQHVRSQRLPFGGAGLRQTQVRPKKPKPRPLPKTTSSIADAEVISSRPNGGGINESRRLALRSGSQELEGIFKPITGERLTGARRSITNTEMTLAQREELAYKVDQLLGTNLVPETVYREVAGEFGSVQKFVSGATTEHKWAGRPLTTEEKYRFGVLDVMIGNADRHRNNYMRVKKTGNPIGIDHGYAFTAGRRSDPLGLRELRSKPSKHLDRPMPDALRRDLLGRLEAVDWEDAIAAYPLSDAERAAFLARAKWLKERLAADDLNKILAGYDGEIGGFGVGVHVPE